MKTFKQHISERHQDVKVFKGFLDAGRFPDARSLKSFLEKRPEYNNIGEGKFSSAWSRGNKSQADMILKVTHPEAIDRGRDPWLSFAALCMKNKGQLGPLYPVIDHVHEFDSGGYCAFIEPLLVNPVKVDILAIQMGSDLDEEGVHIANFLDLSFLIYVMSGNHNQFTYEMSWKKYGHAVKEIDHLLADKFGVRFSDFVNFYHTVSKLPGKHDVHQSNVGFRANGQFVIFDPVG